jgi:hypothetical protein
MPPVEFEPTISAGERLHFYALDRAANGTGKNFPYKRINDLKNQIQNSTSHHESNNSASKKKWLTFTYSSLQIKKINSFFKPTDLKIAFKNTNTILQLIKPQEKQQNSKLQPKRYLHAHV